MHEEKTNKAMLVERTERREVEVRPVPPKRGDGFASLAGSWQSRVRIGDDFDQLPADLAESLGIIS